MCPVNAKDILLDHQLNYQYDYQPGVTFIDGQSIISREEAERVADRGSTRLYTVPPEEIDGVQDTFYLPDSFIPGSVEVYVYGELIDPDLIAYPTSDSVQLPTPPTHADRPVLINFRPATGLPSETDDRQRITIIASNTDLTIEDIEDTLVVFDTSAGSLLINLPSPPTDYSGTTIFKNVGLNAVEMRAANGDSIHNVGTLRLSQQWSVVTLTYYPPRKRWVIKRDGLFTSINPTAAITADETIQELIDEGL